MEVGMSEYAKQGLVSRDAAQTFEEDAESTPGMALELLRFSPERLAAAVGDATVIPKPDVDIVLHTSRETPAAGELWSLSGEIHNRSQVPIWLVDQTTTMTVAPEMYGHSKRHRSVGAFFPTTRPEQGAEVVRIDPGASYAVVWELDPLGDRGETSRRTSLRRLYTIIRDFAFFRPGLFRVSSTIHIWQQKPELDASGAVTNTGASYPITVSRQFAMEASPWVLVAGAVWGGILCFILQFLNGQIPVGVPADIALRNVAVGLGTALVVNSVGTVLISRLATTDFILVIKIKDLWGAIATGFVLQGFGYPALLRLLERIGTLR
jgi:hypothetical protein